MQFKNPEILYALFLLLIPVFIHLFQLRRFQKIDFTNVAFLRKVTSQTRKSSVIKKWLILLTRILALACIIIAFAQPFSSLKTNDTPLETVLYLDNSYSMQGKGAKGPLLKRVLQDLFDKTSGNGSLSWFTNDMERQNSSYEDFKNEILDIEYSYDQLLPSQVLLKANQLFSQSNEVRKQLIFISDFQQKQEFPDIPSDIQVKAVQVKPLKETNVTIDSVFIASKDASVLQLQVKVSKQGEAPSEVPVSLFNKDKLIAKTAVEFSETPTGEIIFDIDASEPFEGRLEISEANIPFDNTLYFSINRPNKIKVLAINGTDGNFLQRLFEDGQFELVQQSFDRLDYSPIPDQNLIVLNQLPEIPNSLASALNSFSDAGGSLLIIPSAAADMDSYNTFLLNLEMGPLGEIERQEKKITKIIFSHPLFQDVFEKKVANFQYPKVNTLYPISGSGTPALAFEDGSPFLIQKNKTYLFAAAIDQENSNFLNSPLVVPTIYNMGLRSLPLPNLYYTIGEQNTFAIPVKLGPDEILSIRDSVGSFIPMQQTKANHVVITTSDTPMKAGNYEVVQKDGHLQNISYNYSREESVLRYLDPSDWQGTEVHKNVDELFLSISEANAINGFWKWFAIFALLFLIVEMLILKFWK